ncbi:meiosis-specific topoisomerase spo11 [Colletotrichum karsti]|uniref:DNA topoisomerase (ATP-hydrolyzing) n=1 Tax=Colletotrichum karsti TaxID=1095194 RepID=A0A9P6IAM6_9PEZI|nr:meiosis-specific topoisomerase spo11 [Colletotrichum karsti]KAF9877056.1 meiosis-specific topoisomerase spo11 [Colletotrichum karsti]
MDHATPNVLGHHSQLIPQHAHQSSSVVDIPDHDPDNNAVGIAIGKLEEILVSVYEALMNDEVLSIPYKTRPNPRRDPATATRSRSAPSVLQFPGRNENESTKFSIQIPTRVLKIIQLSRSALVSGNPVTKRNLYYQCPDLFKTQAIVDGLVDDIAYSLGLGRDGLNIGVIIPMIKSIAQIDFGRAEWVLVIEKDGKGNPDLQTKKFLHLLHVAKPELPVFGLVDYDPYGIRIMRSYSHGTRGHAHETGVTVPSLQWLGIKSGDLVGAVRDDAAERDPYHNNDQRLGLNGQTPARRNFESIDFLKSRDRSIAWGLLKDIPSDVDDYNMECRRELQIMLFLNIKAEIQAVDEAGDISNWLDAHMKRD